MSEYILAHDIGTSSDKACLVSMDGRVTATYTVPYPTYYPHPSWVEQNPADYWNAVCKSTKGIISEHNIDPSEIKGVVFSTQSMGLIPISEDGRILYNNITWVDGRAEKQAQAIMRRLGGKRLFTLLAGTPIMGKDVVSKIVWLKEKKPEIYRETKYFLDVNGYLKFKCTGEMVSELSGASSYGLDLKKKTWLSVLSLVGMDMKKLPPLVKSTDLIGDGITEQAAEETGLLKGTPVFGGCDDVQSACVGSGKTGNNDVHIYLGTSAWVCAVSDDNTSFKNGAAAIQSADPDKNLVVGITEAAGNNIQWIMEQFFAKEREEYGEGIYAYMDKAIENIPAGSDHLICTPWMLGERCPVSDTTTRATLFNINPEHTREHLMRAVYEGIGYNLRWILENFRSDYKIECDHFHIIGGGALDEAWMQIIADITKVSFDVVDAPRSSGALGAAIVAMIGLGRLNGFSDAKQFVKVSKHYVPNPQNAEIYDKLFASYKDVYYSLKAAYKRANLARFNQ